MAKQYGILVDISSCIGCGVCVIACKQENNLSPNIDDIPGTRGIAWNQVLSIAEGVYPELLMFYLYLHCMHCENPPCLEACPKDAIYKREDGVVLIAKGKCNACEDQPGQIRLCIPACPYSAIQFNQDKGTVEACTFCVHRLEVGLEPACVRACLGRCLIFGDLNDPDSRIAQKVKEAGDRAFVLKLEEECGPSILYINPDGVNLAKVSPLNEVKPIFGYKSNYVKPVM